MKLFDIPHFLEERIIDTEQSHRWYEFNHGNKEWQRFDSSNKLDRIHGIVPLSKLELNELFHKDTFEIKPQSWYKHVFEVWHKFEGNYGYLEEKKVRTILRWDDFVMKYQVKNDTILRAIKKNIKCEEK